MKQNIDMVLRHLLVLITLVSLFAISCSGKQSKSSTQVEDHPELMGNYRGIIPCADCEGINQNLSLRKGSTFVLKSKYMGETDREQHMEAGPYTVDNGIITLSTGNSPTMYKIGEGYLEQLDKAGNEIKSSLNYRLMKY